MHALGPIHLLMMVISTRGEQKNIFLLTSLKAIFGPNYPSKGLRQGVPLLRLDSPYPDPQNGQYRYILPPLDTELPYHLLPTSLPGHEETFRTRRDQVSGHYPRMGR